MGTTPAASSGFSSRLPDRRLQGDFKFCCKAIQNYPRTRSFVQKLRVSRGISKNFVFTARYWTERSSIVVDRATQARVLHRLAVFDDAGRANFGGLGGRETDPHEAGPRQTIVSADDDNRHQKDYATRRFSMSAFASGKASGKP
jgi:hypothetical protein